MIEITDLPDMQPMSLWNRLMIRLGRTGVQYPRVCKICQVPTRGNIIIGFWMGCHCD